MTIDFFEKGKVNFTMYDYIIVIIEDIPEDTEIGESETPAGYHLVRINEKDPDKINQEGTITFNHVTEKMLYLGKRSITYVQLGVTFLCTRAKYLEKDQ